VCWIRVTGHGPGTTITESQPLLWRAEDPEDKYTIFLHYAIDIYHFAKQNNEFESINLQISILEVDNISIIKPDKIIQKVLDVVARCCLRLCAAHDAAGDSGSGFVCHSGPGQGFPVCKVPVSRFNKFSPHQYVDTVVLSLTPAVTCCVLPLGINFHLSFCG
jgi:hypothetical protein